MDFQFPSPPLTNPFVFRASAVLLNSPNWDATPLEIACPSQGRLMLYFSYTRGEAAGGFDFQLQYSPYSANPAVVQSWFPESEFSAAVLAAGVDSQSRVQREYVTYQSQGAAIENFVYGPVDLGATVERVRLVARETGQQAVVGTLHVIGTIYSEQ
jgi:hypothetical protein